MRQVTRANVVGPLPRCHVALLMLDHDETRWSRRQAIDITTDESARSRRERRLEDRSRLAVLLPQARREYQAAYVYRFQGMRRGSICARKLTMSDLPQYVGALRASYAISTIGIAPKSWRANKIAASRSSRHDSTRYLTTKIPNVTPCSRTTAPLKCIVAIAYLVAGSDRSPAPQCPSLEFARLGRESVPRRHRRCGRSRKRDQRRPPAFGDENSTVSHRAHGRPILHRRSVRHADCSCCSPVPHSDLDSSS